MGVSQQNTNVTVALIGLTMLLKCPLNEPKRAGGDKIQET
jgi:hypothetical protein